MLNLPGAESKLMIRLADHVLCLCLHICCSPSFVLMGHITDGATSCLGNVLCNTGWGGEADPVSKVQKTHDPKLRLIDPPFLGGGGLLL